MEEIPQPLRRLESHEPMNLYIIKDGKKTTKVYLLNKFKIYLITSGMSINTVRSYMCQVIQLLRKGKQKADKKGVDNEIGPTITIKDIENFLRGKSSINPYSAVKLFLKFCKMEFNQEYYNLELPKIVKKEKSKVEALTEEQVYKIADNMPEDLRFLTLFMYKTGCRIGEPLRMKVGDITWDRVNENKENYAILKVSKTKGKEQRLIPINPKFTEELRAYLISNNRRKASDYIFDFKTEKYFYKKRRKKMGLFLRTDQEMIEYKNNVLWNKFIDAKSKSFEKEFKIASEKVTGKQHTSHILRKSRATTLLKKGVKIIGVRDFLGHKSLKTTERYLTQSIDELTDELKERDL